MNLKTNVDRLVKVSVIGEVASPVFRYPPYNISAFGQLIVCPGVGGIRYNVRVGDSAVNWVADHVEPGVSIKNLSSYPGNPEGPNNALNVLSCIGNEARVVSGEAKGAIGYITGKHGGIEHVMVDFPPEVLDKLVIGDKVQVKAFGQGLKLLDFPDITVMNIDPSLLMKMNLSVEGDCLVVGVTHIIPAGIMGSGLGSNQTYSGDYDITLFDEETVKKHNLSTLRLGDIVAIMDADSTYGRIYRREAVTIGVVVHTNSYIAGHGPGVTTILTSSKGKIKPVINGKANIAYYLNLRPEINW